MDSKLIRYAPDDLVTAGFVKEWMSGAPTIAAHTSGSTGVPKAIALRREDMQASARSTNRFLGIETDSFMVCPLSADYIAGKMMIVRAFEAGARLLMTRPSRRSLFDGVDVASLPVIDLIPVVPAQIDAVIDAANQITIRNVIVGGAPVSSQQEQQLAGAPFTAWATYGMTETCSHVALRNITNGERHFTALPGVELSLDDRGCLVVNGLVTNDIVELDGRRFIWLGRADNVINSGGVKLFPEQLETTIGPLMPDGVEFYFTSRESKLWGREVVMVVLSDEIERAKVMDVCRRELPCAGVPKEIIFDPDPEYTASGKLRRRRL